MNKYYTFIAVGNIPYIRTWNVLRIQILIFKRDHIFNILKILHVVEVARQTADLRVLIEHELMIWLDLQHTPNLHQIIDIKSVICELDKKTRLFIVGQSVCHTVSLVRRCFLVHSKDHVKVGFIHVLLCLIVSMPVHVQHCLLNLILHGG